MSFDFLPEDNKETIFKSVAQYLSEQDFHITSFDDNRPWGGFFVIEEAQAKDFISAFFPRLSMEDFEGYEKLSPKILIVEPGKRLSWQYHHRRAEIWKVVGGTAGVVVSDTDEPGDIKAHESGEIIEIEQGQRHRLVGCQTWGIIAEIWKHSDPENPSDEEDIIRLEDDYGRG